MADQGGSRPALSHPLVGATLALLALEWSVAPPALYLLALQGSYEHPSGSPYSPVLLITSLTLGLTIPIVGSTAAALLRWRFIAAGFALMFVLALVAELTYGVLLVQALR